jgi:cytochrome bd ubiquinol oxidase subunit I
LKGNFDMDSQAFLLHLIRFKFGFMACFHYIFVPLTLGLIVCVACMETVFLRTRARAWEIAARFWFRLFLLGWIVGVATGYPLRAQLASDWGHYFAYVKPLLDRIVPIETAIGPAMLAGVVTIAVFGPRLFPAVRVTIVWGLVALMTCQAVTILSMNAWMQHPTRELFLNPMAISTITHVLSAALVCASTVICGISIIYLGRGQHLPVARVSLRAGVWLGALSSICVMVTGHLSAEHVARYQPMKFAAFEGLWREEHGPAGWVAFALPDPVSQANRLEVKLPYLLSLLTGNGLTGSPPGIREVLASEREQIRRSIGAPNGSSELQGYRELYTREKALATQPVNDDELIRRAAAYTVPSVPVLFTGFRLMAIIGLGLLTAFILGLIFRERLQTEHPRWLWLLVPAVLPLPWLATFAGWTVAEMGRQPWTVYGHLPTFQSAQLPTLAQGVWGALSIVSAYMLLAIMFGLLTARLVWVGPKPRTPSAIATQLVALPSPT